MFYMIIAVVFPSLGMTMLVVASAFLNLELSIPFILIATGILIFVQMMFLPLERYTDESGADKKKSILARANAHLEVCG